MPFRRSGGGVVMAPMPNQEFPKMKNRPTTTTTVEPIAEESEETSPVTKSKVTTVVTTTTASKIVQDKDSKLSLAQKSKLSILKSLKKESSINQTTTKPPVLLQVTKKTYTVVMVEPPTAPNPMLGVRLVSNDSPGMLERVKRLMRQKLLSNSKSLRELTENWDSMICDYIDTSLLTEDHPVPNYLSNSNINLYTPRVFIMLCLHYIVLKE